MSMGTTIIPDSSELTLAVNVDRKSLSAGNLLIIKDSAGQDSLVLLIRKFGDDPALAEWDRRQNYAPFVKIDPFVIECVVSTQPPPAGKPAVDGKMRLGVPLSTLGSSPHLDVVISLGGPHIKLIVDSVVRDEDWPAGPWISGAAIEHTDAVSKVSIEPHVSKESALPAYPPMAQYWAPTDHNAWAGDVMLTANGDRLHLFWLTDRRMHGSKFGCGGCSFAHASTLDLKNWEHHPLAFPLSEYWEAAQGTGCVVVHAGEMYAFATPLTERLGLTKEHPTGPYISTSRDGVHFKKEGWSGLPGEPGMIRDDRGMWHAVSVSQHADGVWRSSRYESTDLRHWRLAQPDFLPEPGWPPSRTVFSSECFNWFRYGAWYYIIGGRTGFWRAQSLLGPYLSVNSAGGPLWDIYDGLMVPQVAVWKGRAIMGGWLALNDRDWAGHLVFRELHQRADGELEMRRLPEMDVPEKHVRFWVEPDSAEAPFKVSLGNGLEMKFDPQHRTAQFGDPAPESMPFLASDFTIYNVEHLNRRFEVDLAIHTDTKSDSVIVDVMIDRRRTMITRRRMDSNTIMPVGKHCKIAH